MVRVITQDTYDEVVRENITEFSMSPQEAINDAVAQFEAQGVDLSNIIKDLALSESTDTHLVVEIVAKLKAVLKSHPNDGAQLTEELDRLRTECDKDLPHRIMAGREGAYGAIIKAITVNKSVLETGINTLIALMNGNPDLLDQSGVKVIISTLTSECPDTTRVATLKWSSICCLKHEMNRQMIFDAGILTILSDLLHVHHDPVFLREACTLIRHLVLDDDVRVEFGKAHDHARLIAQDTLPKLTSMLIDFRSNDSFVAELLLTLSSLLVRTEFCQIVEDAGGLKFIIEILVDFHENEKLIRQCFKLLKALAGNDDVKRNIIKSGAAPLISSCFDRHKVSENTAVAGLACIAAISLREQTNGKQLLDSGIAEPIIQCMKMYPGSLSIQKNASWAIRNIVYKNKDRKAEFLELGAEELLNASLKKFDKECGFDIKSALRDLGCSVKFDEQWTGTGGMIHSNTDSVPSTQR